MSSDSKGVKAALKEAREKIDAKDFKSALKCCRRALNVDPNHFLALVFAGLCQGETGQYQQAVESYHKAMSKDPSQLVAWQGLASFYEKHSSKMGEDGRAERVEDLARTYCGLAERQLGAGSVAKYMETSEKLRRTAMESGDVEGAVAALVDMLRVAEGAEEGAGSKEDRRRWKREARGGIIEVLSKQQDMRDEQNKLFADVLQAALAEGRGDQSIQSMENAKLLIKHHYKLRNMTDLLSAALSMTKTFPSHIYPLEWICKVHLEWATGTLDFQSADLENEGVRPHVNRLLELSPRSALGRLSCGVLAWRDGKLKEAREMLEVALKASAANPNFYGSYALCSCLFELGDFPAVETAVALCRRLLDAKVKEEETRSVVRTRLASLLVRSLYRQGDLARARGALEELGDERAGRDKELALIRIKVRAAYCQGEGQEAEEIEQEIDELEAIPEHEVSVLKATLCKSLGKMEEAKRHLEEALQTRKECFEALLLMGKILYEQKSDQALPFLLRAAKADPKSPEPFLLLGHLYFGRWKKDRSSEADLDKARKCLQKAFSLAGGRTDVKEAEEAGSALSDIYRELGATDSNMTFLMSVTKQSTASSGKATWAFLRLGMLYLEKDDSTNSIQSLQSALRGDPKSLTAWECLADAYKARGSYTASAKAYEQVLKLDPDSCYAELQLGSLQLLLGHLDEADASFRRVLEKCSGDSPLMVPGLKGLAECLVQSAKVALDEFVDARAVRCCQEALSLLARAARADPAVSCLWKLMGEACILLRELPEETVEGIKIPDVLLSPNPGDVSASSPCNKHRLLEVGSRCLLRATKCDPGLASAWRDLAVCYYARTQLPDICTNGGLEEVGKLKDKALSAARRCLAIEPKSAESWNLLGYLALNFDKFALAQHAFVLSVTIENNASAWANLGILYLLSGNDELANASFNESQKADPSSLPGWVGQATLAQNHGHDEEAMDLFRHTTFLGNDIESGLGYSNWVCKTLQAMSTNSEMPLPKAHNRYCIEKMYGVTVAVDCLDRCISRVKDQESLNLLGILLEQDGHLRRSRRVLEDCLSVSSSLGGGDEAVQTCHRNLARVCLKLGDHAAAVGYASAVAVPDKECLSTLAAAHHGAGQFRESYMTYQKCLDVVAEDQKAHYLAAMASIAYRFQGPEAAKTLLFQSSQLNPPSIPGLFALCVLGVKEGDASLAEAALGEMSKHGADSDPRYIHQTAALRALVAATLGGRRDDARRTLARTAHSHPHLAGVWSAAARHLVVFQCEAHLLRSASRMAEKAAGLARLGKGDLSDERPLSARWRPAVGESKVAAEDDVNLVTLSLLLASKAGGGDDKSGVQLYRSAAKAAHLNPDDPSAWTLLALAQKGSKASQSRFADRARKILALSTSKGELMSNLEDYLGRLLIAP